MSRSAFPAGDSNFVRSECVAQAAILPCFPSLFFIIWGRHSSLMHYLPYTLMPKMIGDMCSSTQAHSVSDLFLGCPKTIQAFPSLEASSTPAEVSGYTRACLGALSLVNAQHSLHRPYMVEYTDSLTNHVNAFEMLSRTRCRLYTSGDCCCFTDDAQQLQHSASHLLFRSSLRRAFVCTHTGCL